MLTGINLCLEKNFSRAFLIETPCPLISEFSGFVDVFLFFYSTDQSKGLLDALEAFFIKLDHAACQQSIKYWEALAETLRVYFATHEKNSLGELWTDLIGGHNITFIRIWYPPKIKCQRLTGNWPNIKLMQQDGSSGKVWLLFFFFELTSSLILQK